MAAPLQPWAVRVNNRISEIAEDIVRYLVQHPEAADTLEGIARWRLAQQNIERTVDETAAALRLLTERGLVDEIRTGAGPAVFRLKTEVQPDPDPTVRGAANRR